jgi:hypothetical protein
MIIFLPYHTINCHYNEVYISLYKGYYNYYKDGALEEIQKNTLLGLQWDNNLNQSRG